MSRMHTAVWLGVALVLLAALPRASGVSVEHCQELEKLSAQPEVFRFADMEKWNTARDPQCCKWPGVSCLGEDRFQIYLTDVSGNGTAVDVSAPVSYLHIEPRGDDLASLPSCSWCAADCMTLLAIVGRQHAESGWPRIRVPEIPGWCVHDVMLKRVHVIGHADLRLLRSDRGPTGTLTMLDVHVDDRRMVLSPTRALHMERVSGVELLQPANGSFVGESVSAHAMPDLVECAGEWRVEGGAGDSSPLAMTLKFADCPRLRYAPRTVGGHVSLSLERLPALLRVPSVRTDVYGVVLHSLNASVVREWMPPAGRDAQLQVIEITDCGLRDGDLPLTLPTLRVLNLAHNALTHVPVGAVNETNVDRLVLDGNPIAELPRDWGLVSEFSCVACALRGEVDVSNAPFRTVNLAWNRIESLMLSGVTERLVNVSHNELVSLLVPSGVPPNNLHTLDASYNFLTIESGLAHAMFGQLVGHVDVSHNDLRGSLAGHVIQSGLEYFNVSHNHITRLPSIGSGLHHGSSVLPFRVLDLSHNDIDHLNVDYLSNTGHISNYMETCDVSHNRLTRWSELSRMLRAASSLRSFRAEANALHWDEPNKPFFPNALPSLREFSLSNNSFTGPVPALGDLGAATTVELRASGFAATCGAGVRVGANGTMPCLGAVSIGAMVTTDRGALCPELHIEVGGGRRLVSDLEPSYHALHMCQCKFGYCKQANTLSCAAAPEHVLCRGGQHSATPAAMKGYFLETREQCAGRAAAAAAAADATGAGAWVHVSECPREFRAQCAPHSTLAAALRDDANFAALCREGYEGRMCSACSTGYYRWVGTCLHCPASRATAEGVAAASIVLMLLGALYAAFVMDAAHDATLKLSVFALQLAAMIGYLHGSFAPFLRNFLQVCGLALGDVPYMNGCVHAHHALSALEGALLVLSFCFAVPLTAWTLGRAWLLRPGSDPAAAPRLLRRCVRACTVLFWLAFQKLMLVLPQYFQCHADACAGGDVLARFPFARCTGSARSGSLAATTLFSLVCVPLPFAVCTWALRRHARGADLFGTEFLVAGFRDGWQWWELLLLGAKVLIGLFASLVLGDRVFSSFFVSLIALVLFLLHSKATPYASVASNQTAHAILLGAVITLGSTMASNSAALSGDVGFGALFVLIQTGALAMAVAYMVGVQLFGAKTPWRVRGDDAL